MVTPDLEFKIYNFCKIYQDNANNLISQLRRLQEGPSGDCIIQRAIKKVHKLMGEYEFIRGTRSDLQKKIASVKYLDPCSPQAMGSSAGRGFSIQFHTSASTQKDRLNEVLKMATSRPLLERAASEIPSTRRRSRLSLGSFFGRSGSCERTNSEYDLPSGWLRSFADFLTLMNSISKKQGALCEIMKNRRDNFLRLECELRPHLAPDRRVT